MDGEIHSHGFVRWQLLAPIKQIENLNSFMGFPPTDIG